MSELELRDYQRDGAAFLAANNGALLADEMGLGKTAQAIVALRLVLQASPGRALVIAPSSLMRNWEKELGQWAPELFTRRVIGDQFDRLAYYSLPIQVLLASYDQIRRDAVLMPSATRFGTVILDEAQRIKNRDSDTSLACRLVQRDRSWALSGTPLENDHRDLLAILSFVVPDMARFHMGTRELHAILKPRFLRRTKAKVATELPPIIDQSLEIELTSSQYAAYWDAWERGHEMAGAHPATSGAAGLLALITTLKQLCNFEPQSDHSSKLDALRTLVDGLGAPNNKIIVFSQFVGTLKWLSEHDLGLETLLYHGGQTLEEREEVLQRFRAGNGPTALLMSIKAGGVGLNLPQASVVVLFDRWWNPAVEDQAIQRAHRLGRSEPLHVVRFVTRATVEERIVQILHEKREVFREVVEGAGSADLSAPSVATLRMLLEPARSDF